ncbi:MAG: MarR family winged helix-turn-helix transcriptional regulator [Acidimicrobiales bacterium]
MVTPPTSQPRDQSAQSVDAVRALTRVARALERACGDLPMAHYRVLSAIAAGEDRASRVAERLALGRPAVSAAVDALSRQGYLVGERVAGDARAVDLRLSATGAALVARVERAMTDLFDDLRRATPEGDCLLRALAALNGVLDERYRARRGSRAPGGV